MEREKEKQDYGSTWHYIPKDLTFRPIDIPFLQQPPHLLKRVISVTGTFHHLTVVKLIPS